ncbi:MAG: AEC family transporter [Anaerolineales bacterium]|nr:AEC family transporter [Anaerolineales bacterium]
MSEIFTVFTQNILPILIVAGFGYGLQRWKPVDKKSLSGIVFNILSPCLVFASLVNSQLLGDELLDLGLFAVLAIGTMGVLAFMVARVLGLSRRETAVLMIVTMFVNNGNFGLTLVNLRYGDAGVSRAIVYYATSTMLVYTLGAFIASLGSLHWRDALKRMIRLPAVYAAFGAVIVYSLNIPVPRPLMSAIEVAGAGAIPVMLLVLGMQMADLQGGFNIRLAVPAISMRLLLGPIIGLVVATFIGLEGLGRSTSIVQTSMPPAVFTIVLATEFGLKATVVTGIVVVATLISPLTIALAITLLGL